MMMAALGLFVAGSVLCAVAPDMATLIAGRTLQGIGGGGIVPMVQITVADMVTPRERGRYQAYMGTAWITAGTVGPALGGVIAQNWHWSLIFWLNVPLGLLTAALLNQSMKRLPAAGRRHKLDFLGAALVMAAATLFLLALTTGGTRVPWISPTIFSLIGASILLTVVVGWWLKRAPEPFLPLNVLANPVMKLGTAATSFAMAVMTGFMIYMPLYFQMVHKLTPTQAGLCAHPGDRDDDAGLDGVGPRDDASQPLQALALCRHGAGDVGGRGAGRAGRPCRCSGRWSRPRSSATASAPCSRSPPSACRTRCGGTRSASRPAR